MIEDPPPLTIRRPTARPDPALLARLVGAQSGHVADAMDGSGALLATIKPIDPTHATFVGVALTCQNGPGDNLAILAAVALAQPGDVLIAAADGFAGVSVMGDNVASMARNAGMLALVTDGMARDVAGIVAVGLPVFAAGVTPNSCARSGPGRIGLPVVIGGIAVESGDAVVGDADGVVIVPRAQLAEVIARLDAVLAAERTLEARIADGLICLDSVARLLASDGVRMLEEKPV